MKKIKNGIIVTTVFVLLIFIFIMIYLLSSKYDDVNILSFRREYNLVFKSSEDRLDIDICLDKKKTFLTDIQEIEKVSITNSNYTFKCEVDSITDAGTIKYDELNYYIYNYSLKFNSYDEYQEPVFLSDAKLNITYNNGTIMNYEIGNMSLFFNTTSEYDYNDIVITKLSSVSNEINGIETIVGINIEIYNNTTNKININSILIKNKYYELDYLNYYNEFLDTKENIKDKFTDYKYEEKTISKDNLNLAINQNDKVKMFIPLKYMNGIKYVDRFPLYISYSINDNQKMFIQDDFKFISSKSILLSVNGIEKYVYKYL